MSRLEVYLALFFFALCVVLSTQAPLRQSRPASPVDDTEAAMWSRVQTRRARKATVGQTVDTTVESSAEETSNSNKQVPKFILDLYASLSNKQHDVINPAVIDLENTIRALPTTTAVCGQYNFSLASQIFSDESILHSELHLYKRPKVLSANSEHKINIYRYITGHDSELVISRSVSSDQEEEEVFDVLSAVQDWKEHMLNHPEHNSRYAFQLEIVGESCEESNLQFVHSKDSDSDKQPQLVIYSYDPKTKAVDYKSILQTSEGKASVAPKQRRSADTTPFGSSVRPSCGVYELDIDADHLESLDFFAGYNIIAPRKYNAGICGGTCQKQYPFTSSFVHLLINKNTFTNRDYNISQGCSPVKYSPITVLMAKSDSIVIKRFANIAIESCKCTNVVTFK